MIRQLEAEDWINFISKFNKFTYVFHRFLNIKPVKEPLSSKLFSDAVVELAVRTEDNLINSFVFDNAGLINIIMQDPITRERIPALDENSEFDLVKEFPEALSITCNFMSLMIQKFGKNYLNRRLIHSDNMRKQMEERRKELEFQYNYLRTIFQNVRTDRKTILSSEFVSAEKQGYEALKKHLCKPSEFYGISYSLTYPQTHTPIPKPNKVRLLKPSEMDELIMDEIYTLNEEINEEYKAATSYAAIQQNLMNYACNTYINQRFTLIDTTKSDNEAQRT